MSNAIERESTRSLDGRRDTHVLEAMGFKAKYWQVTVQTNKTKWEQDITS